MTSTGMWKREGHDSCLAEIARLTAALSEAQRERDALRATSRDNLDSYVQAHNRAVDAEAGRDAAVKRAEEQAALRRVAEDAIPRGIEVAKEFIRAEYERRLALAERVVEAAEKLAPFAQAAIEEAAGWSSRDEREGREAIAGWESAVAEYRKAAGK